MTSMRKKQPVPRKKTRILIVDDHQILREGIAKIIDLEPDLEVSALAGTIPDAMAAIESSMPDIVLVDISLKDANGITLVKDLKAQYPKLPALVLSMHDESFYAERALRAGARGYIMKQEPTARLIESIRRVLSGQIVVSPVVSEHMLTVLADGKSAPAQSPVELLSDREVEVFTLVGQGLGRKQIAGKLCISVKTVEAHRANIVEKLKMKSTSQLLPYAIQWFKSRAES